MKGRWGDHVGWGRLGQQVGWWPGTGSHVPVRPLHPAGRWRQCFGWGSVGLLGCPHKSVLVGKDHWIVLAQLTQLGVVGIGVETSRGHRSQTQRTNQ